MTPIAYNYRHDIFKKMHPKGLAEVVNLKIDDKFIRYSCLNFQSIDNYCYATTNRLHRLMYRGTLPH